MIDCMAVLYLMVGAMRIRLDKVGGCGGEYGAIWSNADKV